MTWGTRRQRIDFAIGGCIGIVLAIVGMIWIIGRNDNAAYHMRYQVEQVSSGLLPYIREATEKGHSVRTVHELTLVVDQEQAQEIQGIFDKSQPSSPDSYMPELAIEDIWWRNEPDRCVFVFLWEEGAVSIAYGADGSVESIDFLEDDHVPERLSVPSKP